MRELKFVDLDLFEAVSEQRLRIDEQRFVVKDPGGGKVGITPGLSIHRDLTVLGTDWIPMRPDGIATLEQMTHTPHQFLGKARNVREQDGRWFEATASQRRIDEPVLVAGGNINYYHWFIDNVPRLLIADKYGELDGRRVLVNHDLRPFAADTLRLLGIEDERLVRVAADESLLCGDACVPNMLAAVTIVHPCVPELIRESLPIPRRGKKRRIYLSRQDAPTRRLANEEALVELLEKHGFERHVPSQMTLAQQIDACADAEAIVAVHGAALTNMLFAPPGAKVIEIFSPAHAPTFFVLLAHMCGVTHTFSPAALVEADPQKSPLHHVRWEVDLAAMQDALRQLGG